MPYQEPDPSDPTVLVGVALPADPETTTEMAYAFAEEFAAMGHGAEPILALFRDPYYAGAHDAYRRLGEAEVRRIVTECVQAYGGVRFVVRDAPAGNHGAIDRRSARTAEEE